MINISTQKNFVGLYIWANGGDGKIMEKYAGEFPKSAASKGCINIKSLDFLKKYEDAIKRIVSEVSE